MRAKTRFAICRCALLLLLGLALSAGAAVPKSDPTPLDDLAFRRPELRVVPTIANCDALRGVAPNIPAIDAFRAENGECWEFFFDLRTGRVVLADGGAIPMIPGAANNLSWDDFPQGCRDITCLPAEFVGSLARAFLLRYRETFLVDPAELVLSPGGCGPMGASVYLIRFQRVVGGNPVSGALVYLIINSGNLVQVGLDHFNQVDLDPSPSLSTTQAWAGLRSYLSPYASEQDIIVDAGSLSILPTTPTGLDPDIYNGLFGGMADCRLAYHISFRSALFKGLWEALVDAQTGEILSFQDALRYGKIRGGVYLRDGYAEEVNRPFPFADTGGPAPNDFADSAGKFEGADATSTLTGKYSGIIEECGEVRGSTDTGDLDFRQGPGTRCDTPPGWIGGAGNTHAARTIYYHTNRIREKAHAYHPTNSWLNSSFTLVTVEMKSSCNAHSITGDMSLAFSQSEPQLCLSFAETPSIICHEWSHLLGFALQGKIQNSDEAAADIGAILQLHDSCIGRGTSLIGPCLGDGNPCKDCTGLRDADRFMLRDSRPCSLATLGTELYNCWAGAKYPGPCGTEDHCEGMLAAQALWELANTDLPSLGSTDLATAWQIADRLWYIGLPILGDMYTCVRAGDDFIGDGCGTGSIYRIFRAIDDDGDGTANGTPHASAIFSALNRHGIACGLATARQNQNGSTCPPLTAAALSGRAGSDSVELFWPPVENARHYNIYRNEAACGDAFTRVGRVEAPATAYRDSAVARGVPYSYRLEAVSGTDSCASPLSACLTLTPAYDLSLADNAGRSSLCLNSVTGDFLWTVLKGHRAGTTFSGTATVEFTSSGAMRVRAGCGDPGYAFCLKATYRDDKHKASATCKAKRLGKTFSLADSNTRDNPPCP